MISTNVILINSQELYIIGQNNQQFRSGGKKERKTVRIELNTNLFEETCP
jgi:hypothetical protein